MSWDRVKACCLSLQSYIDRDLTKKKLKHLFENKSHAKELAKFYESDRILAIMAMMVYHYTRRSSFVFYLNENLALYVPQGIRVKTIIKAFKTQNFYLFIK